METALATPSVFKRNKYGHITFPIIGSGFTGAGEINLLIAAGKRIGGHAESMFLSKRGDGYDAKHRLIAGKMYIVVLLPGKRFANDSQRTTKNMCEEAKAFGYSKSLAGIVSPTRMVVSDKQMEEWGFRHITPLHDPIADDDSKDSLSRVFTIVCRHLGPWIRSYRDNPDSPWVFGDSAFAFLES